MKCPNCDSDYEPGEKFCKHCGEVFEGALTPVPWSTRLTRVFEYITGEDLNHERVSSMIRQILGLIAIIVTIFAIARKPSPGIFMLYAIPGLLAGVVIVLERRASVGKALFTLLMIVPYLTLFLFGVPPILSSGAQETLRETNGLSGFFGSISTSVFFVMMGFLYIIFSSIVAQFFNKRLSLVAGVIALGLSLIFTSSFMGLLGSPSAAVYASVIIEDKLVEKVSLQAAANPPADDGTIQATAAFKSNEIIYPFASGLAGGSSFGLRVVDAQGNVIVEFDRSKAAKVHSAGLTAGAVAFNTADNRLPAGSYALELLVLDGWKTTVGARLPFTMSADINPTYGENTGNAYGWLSSVQSGAAELSFTPDKEMHLVLDGAKLQSDVRLLIRDSGDKIVFDKKFAALSIGKSDYAVVAKASDLGSGNFIAALTSTGKEPVTIYFKIQ